VENQTAQTMSASVEALADALDTLAGDMRVLRIDIARLVDADPTDIRFRALEGRLDGLFRTADRAAAEADQLAMRLRLDDPEDATP
jgi:hypothetical protein